MTTATKEPTSAGEMVAEKLAARKRQQQRQATERYREFIHQAADGELREADFAKLEKTWGILGIAAENFDADVAAFKKWRELGQQVTRERSAELQERYIAAGKRVMALQKELFEAKCAQRQADSQRRSQAYMRREQKQLEYAHPLVFLVEEEEG